MERLKDKLIEILDEQDFCFTLAEMQVVERALRRLAAYEDTELEPEEIVKLIDKLNAAEECICKIEVALNRGTDNGGAREAISEYESALKHEKTKEANKLKPCPFCDGKAEVETQDYSLGDNIYRKTYSVVCKRCRCRTSDYMGKAGAVDAWSRRAEK